MWLLLIPIGLGIAWYALKNSNATVPNSTPQTSSPLQPPTQVQSPVSQTAPVASPVYQDNGNSNSGNYITDGTGSGGANTSNNPVSTANPPPTNSVSPSPVTTNAAPTSSTASPITPIANPVPSPISSPKPQDGNVSYGITPFAPAPVVTAPQTSAQVVAKAIAAAPIAPTIRFLGGQSNNASIQSMLPKIPYNPDGSINYGTGTAVSDTLNSILRIFKPSPITTTIAVPTATKKWLVDRAVPANRIAVW